jgi:hypothetical protein
MPETAAVNDAYEVRIVGRMEGQETNNVLHFLCTGADPDVLLHLVLVLAECFIDNLLPVLSSKWTLEKLVWKRVAPTLGPEIVSVPVGAGAGGGAATALPSFNSVVFSKRSTQGGGRHRGRMYLAGIPEGATTDSFLNTADPFWAALLAFAVCVITNFTPGDPPGAPSWAFMIYSREIGGSSFPYGLTGFTPVKEFVPQQLIGTTRSRKVGRGA